MGGVVFFQPSFLPSIFVSCLLFQDDKLFIELLDQSELRVSWVFGWSAVHHAFSLAN